MDTYRINANCVDDAAEFNGSVGRSFSPKSSPKCSYEGEKPKDERNYDTRGLQNWIILGDDNFVAAQATQKELTPGMYELFNSANGVVFSRLNVITDKIFTLADHTSDKIVKSIENFWNSRSKFDEFGMIFKRGIMVFGPAGTGKTIAIQMLSKKIIDKGGIVINTRIPSVTIQGLKIVRTIQPDVPIVNVMEDIDTIIDRFGESEILSLLDGENQIDNITNLATTNYPERLDPRLKNRPSRFDEVYKMDFPNSDIRKKYLISITEGHVSDEFIREEIDRWVTDTFNFSIAHLRELVVGVLCLGSNYEDVIQRLRTQIRSKPKSNAETGNVGF